MVKENRQKLTLDRPATYQIKVPGVLKQRWVEQDGDPSVINGIDDTGLQTTTLTSTIDQAGLHGLLRRLYSLGLPIISVICVDVH